MKTGQVIPYSINIKASNNMGLVVKIGCQTLVFTDMAEAAGTISDFIRHPKKAEEVLMKTESSRPSIPVDPCEEVEAGREGG